MYSGGVVLGAATTATAAVVLPNTGSNQVLTIVAFTSMICGITIVVTSVARFVAKKAFKA